MRVAIRKLLEARYAVQILISTNLLIMLGLLALDVARVPPTVLEGSILDSVLKVSIKGWIVLSTLAATYVFIRRLALRGRGSAAAKGNELVWAGLVLGLWWLFLIWLALYGYALGHGG